MKKMFAALILVGVSLLTGCTGINGKCAYIPPGECWQDDGKCHPKVPDPTTYCRGFWSCGYNHHFPDT